MIKKTAAYGILILCTLLFVYCTTDEETMIGPFGNADKYITAASFDAENDTLYADGDSTKIVIILLDINKSPLEGLKVSFSTDFGEITDFDITDSTGTAEAIFVSNEIDGETVITAYTGAKNFEIPIQVIKYQPKTIELSAESRVLIADENDYTKITAIPRDKDGKIMPDILIKFATSLGTLSSNETSSGNATSLEINSGDTGEDAVVYLWSSTNIGTAEITAIAGDTSSIDISFYLDLPAYLTISALPKVILADGSSTSIITATVLDNNLTAMEGIKVSFSTTAGTLPQLNVTVTDENGEASIELTSSTEEETATVTASTNISSAIDVLFTLNIPDQIEISASPKRVIADGSTKSTITAIPKDKDGNPMVGIDVSFNTTLGTLSRSFCTTDASGVATVELYSSTEGTATITASVSSTEATTSVTFYEYNPARIEIESGESSILADGVSKVDIIARAIDSSGDAITGAIIDFSTNYGHLNKTNGVVANQQGDATITLTSEGSTYDLDTRVKAEVQGYNISDSVAVKFRGITMTTYIDSTKFAEGGYYNVFVRTTLIETSLGTIVDEATVVYLTTIGEMQPEVSAVNEFGEASSVLFAEVTGSQQNGLVITSELPNSTKVSKQTNSMTIPGVETIVSTIDDEVMGDGESWALVKATLRETTGKAITNMVVDWETTRGTIIGKSLTNTNGHSIDTLRIENKVSTNTNVTISSHFGDNVSDSEIVTFIPPVNNNRLILGFEPDTTGHGYVPCDIDTSIATRDVGINAHYVDENGNGIDGETISFSVVPTNLAAICPTATTMGAENGRATVMMAYPPQNAGQIVRVWGEAPDGTRGNIDVILPKDEEEDDGG